MWLRPRFEFEPARSWIGREEALVDVYLTEERLTCCSFQAGFFIDVDGVPWSDDGTVDEPWMTLVWFHALRDLLRGSPDTGPMTGPWEESRMTWSLVGDTLAMVDDVAPRVEVPFEDFATRLFEEGRLLASIARTVRASVERRRALTSDPTIREKLDTIAKALDLEGEYGFVVLDECIALLEARNRP
jgi:hypothetical protein